MQKLLSELRERLQQAVKRNSASCLLFSGGLDTSILAALSPNSRTITISLKSFGEDAQYARLVAKDLKLKYFHRVVDVDEAIEAIPEVIKILKTFDPAIPNDLVVYFGLKKAKELGINKVMTGDGSDELFGGYSFMKEISNLKDYIRRISQTMEFSSNELGKFFNIGIKQPYLDKEIVASALDISTEFKIRREDGRVWGKWILRKAFQDLLPKEIIWQDKRPLEYGSGMRRLRSIISAKITDEEFEKNPYPVKLMNKEHLYYYKVYKKVIGEIPKSSKAEKGCPGCGAAVNTGAFHCRVCGYTLDRGL